jgi:hypothetical protein
MHPRLFASFPLVLHFNIHSRIEAAPEKQPPEPETDFPDQLHLESGVPEHIPNRECDAVPCLALCS